MTVAHPFAPGWELDDMPWFKVDDSFYDHPKVFDAPDCAVALWIRAGCWSARNLTDGFVPSSMLARLCGDPDTAARQLLDRGLWRRTRGGYLFHDWASYQPSAEKVKATRTKRAEAGRRGGQAKAAKQNAGKALANCQPFAKQNPAPSRPETLSRDGVSNHPADRNARAPRDDFDEHMIEAVAKAAFETHGLPLGDDQALSVAARVLERARRKAIAVQDPARFVATVIANEPDMYAELLEPPPPLRDVLAGFARDTPVTHEFEPHPVTGACLSCEMPRSNYRHREAS